MPSLDEQIGRREVPPFQCRQEVQSAAQKGEDGQDRIVATCRARRLLNELSKTKGTVSSRDRCVYMCGRCLKWHLRFVKNSRPCSGRKFHVPRACSELVTQHIGCKRAYGRACIICRHESLQQATWFFRQQDIFKTKEMVVLDSRKCRTLRELSEPTIPSQAASA